MSPLRLFIDGVAWWTPSLTSWDAARHAWVQTGLEEHSPSTALLLRRPTPSSLPPAERRRAPDTVALALEVAHAAVTASGHEAGELLSVFTSAHGDLALTDAMCDVLARTPRLVSPTKFIHSVHNAPSGYWSMVAQCPQASTALSAFRSSFAVGCLEAAMQCVADDRAVLLVGYDTAAGGALADSTQSEGTLAMALVLSPRRGPRSVAGLQVEAVAHDTTGTGSPSRACHALAQPLQRNGMHDALPLFEALARLVQSHPTSANPMIDTPKHPADRVVLCLSSSLHLHLSLEHL